MHWLFSSANTRIVSRTSCTRLSSSTSCRSRRAPPMSARARRSRSSTRSLSRRVSSSATKRFVPHYGLASHNAAYLGQRRGARRLEKFEGWSPWRWAKNTLQMPSSAFFPFVVLRPLSLRISRSGWPIRGDGHHESSQMFLAQGWREMDKFVDSFRVHVQSGAYF
jgi:hypothetical protein